MTPIATKQTISAAAAAAMVDVAVAKARELEVAQVVAVVDESGLLTAFRRMDGAPLVSIEVAQNKAYTALYGLPSHTLFEAIKNDDALRTALPHVPRLTLIGGGVPIRLGGTVVGAVGVGGGTVDQDIAVAEAALTAIRPA